MATLKKAVVTEEPKAPEKKTEPKAPRVPKAPTVGKRPAGQNTVIIKTEMVDLSHLTVYYKNPRIGNIDEIAKSLHSNGQFKPIVVNVGTKTGRKFEILAGNHTFMAAKKTLEWQQDGRHMRKEPWSKLYAAFVDVTEDEAKRIVLADNRTTEYGVYDDKVLAQLFAELPDTVGTGFHREEIDSIIANLPQPEEIQAQIKSLEDFKAAMPAPITGPESDNRVGGTAPSEWGNGELEIGGDDGEMVDWGELDDEEGDDEMIDIDDVSVQLQATLQLREANVPNGDNDWGVPELREDMLLRVEDIKDLRTWADKDLTPDDRKSTFFANFASGARKGMPFDRTVMAFYNEDHEFDKWFDEPSWYVTKFSLLGINKAVVPDYSLYGDSARAVHLFNVFKAMWLGRFMQDAGWRVAPRLQFAADDPKTMEIALLGHPVGAPVLVLGAQTWGGSTDQHVDNWKKGLAYAVQKLDPEVLVAYVGTPGKKVVEQTSFGKWKGEIRYIDSVSTIRNRKRDENAKRTSDRKRRLKAAKEKVATELAAERSGEVGVTDTPEETPSD